MNKYRNAKIVTSLGLFDSKIEYRRFLELTILSETNAIKDLQRQVRIPLLCKEARLSYIMDFVYFDNNLNSIVCEDVKGFATEAYKIKRKILLATFSNIIFIEYCKGKITKFKPFKIADKEFIISLS